MADLPIGPFLRQITRTAEAVSARAAPGARAAVRAAMGLIPDESGRIVTLAVGGGRRPIRLLMNPSGDELHDMMRLTNHNTIGAITPRGTYIADGNHATHDLIASLNPDYTPIRSVRTNNAGDLAEATQRLRLMEASAPRSLDSGTNLSPLAATLRSLGDNQNVSHTIAELRYRLPELRAKWRLDDVRANPDGPIALELLNRGVPIPDVERALNIRAPIIRQLAARRNVDFTRVAKNYSRRAATADRDARIAELYSGGMRSPQIIEQLRHEGFGEVRQHTVWQVAQRESLHSPNPNLGGGYRRGRIKPETISAAAELVDFATWLHGNGRLSHAAEAQLGNELGLSAASVRKYLRLARQGHAGETAQQQALGLPIRRGGRLAAGERFHPAPAVAERASNETAPAIPEINEAIAPTRNERIAQLKRQEPSLSINEVRARLAEEGHHGVSDGMIVGVWKRQRDANAAFDEAARATSDEQMAARLGIPVERVRAISAARQTKTAEAVSFTPVQEARIAKLMRERGLSEGRAIEMVVHPQSLRGSAALRDPYSNRFTGQLRGGSPFAPIARFPGRKRDLLKVLALMGGGAGAAMSIDHEARRRALLAQMQGY